MKTTRLQFLSSLKKVMNKIFILKNAWLVLSFFCLLVLSTTTYSAEFSGKYLLHICSSDKAGNELIKGGHTACQAYIAGIIDYHSLIKSLKTAPGLDFCIPKDTPLSIIQQGMVLYLLKNGQHDDFIASPAVAIALNQMYPCRKKKKKK